MGLDLAGLKEFDKELDNRSGGGLMLYQKELGPDGMDWRLATAHPNLNGRYFIEVIKWWVNGKAYISPATFGYPDVVQEAIDQEDSTTKDKGIKALLANEDKLQKASEFWMVGFQVKVTGEKNLEAKVIGDKARVLSCTTMLARAVNQLVTGRIASRIDSEDGITDRVSGYNMILAKEKKANRTTYKAELGDQVELEAKYYNELPDILEIARKGCNSDAYLLQVLDNYLYGDDLPDEDKEKGKIVLKGSSRRSEPVKEEVKEVEPEPEKQESSSRRSTVATETKEDPAPATGRRSRGGLLSSLETNNAID